jgi:hypothetical protein
MQDFDVDLENSQSNQGDQQQQTQQDQQGSSMEQVSLWLWVVGGCGGAGAQRSVPLKVPSRCRASGAPTLRKRSATQPRAALSQARTPTSG